jgi:D-threonate/D-erythronate kinase
MMVRERAVELVIDARAASISPHIAAREALDKAKPLLADAKSFVVATGLVQKTDTDPDKITDAIALAAAELIRTLPIDGLILTGGDTAAAVFRKLGVPSIKLAGEIEPGIPLGIISTPRPITVITKAGGFGSMDTLSNAAAVLRNAKIGAAK